MSDVIFRRLLAADAAEFQALRLSALAELPLAFSNTPDQEADTPIEKISSRLEGSKDFTVGAFIGEKLIGTSNIELEANPRFKHKAWLWGFYVPPESRRLGIGRLLLLATLEAVFSIDAVRQVNLGVNAINDAAKTLYESCGFVSFGHERSYMIVDGIPQNEYHMVCHRAAFESLRLDSRLSPQGTMTP